MLQCYLHESHLPEQMFSYRSVIEPTTNEDQQACPARDRPSVLLAQPEPAQVIAVIPDGPPSRLRWRGREYHVCSSFGPERICQEWWSGPLDGQCELNARDYFKVQDSHGRWLWVYRQLEENRWFVHGLWA